MGTYGELEDTSRLAVECAASANESRLKVNDTAVYRKYVEYERQNTKAEQWRKRLPRQNAQQSLQSEGTNVSMGD
jgi:hypothetical protein